MKCKLVPEEATLEMEQAYYENFGIQADYKSAYKAMLAAAPQPKTEAITNEYIADVIYGIGDRFILSNFPVGVKIQKISNKYRTKL